MKQLVIGILIAATTALANISSATDTPTAFTGTFSWDGARTPAPNYFWWDCLKGPNECPID